MDLTEKFIAGWIVGALTVGATILGGWDALITVAARIGGAL